MGNSGASIVQIPPRSLEQDAIKGTEFGHSIWVYTKGKIALW